MIKVEEFVNEVLKNDFKVLDVRVDEEHNNMYLRVTIDTINLDDCVKASKKLSKELDKGNLINDKYILEVYSKGEEE